MRRLIPLLTVCVLLAGVGSFARVQAQDQRCFPETGKCISGSIRTYWENTGGLSVYGYPITDLAVETNADGFTGPTQWFERDRLEDHSVEAIGVLAGRLGAQKLAMEGRPWEAFPKVPSAPAGCRWFAETGHSLCPPFLAYWERNNSLTRFGFPISEPMVETNAAGFTGTVQWFERRRMELHPENQPPYDILLGLLGNEVHGGATPLPIVQQPTQVPLPVPQPTQVPPPPAQPTATRVPPTPVPPRPTATTAPPAQNCHSSYPDFCIPPPPPNLNCSDVAPHKNFRVRQPDPHGFDRDKDGIGCES